MKKIGILYHPMVEATHIKAKQVQDFLKSRGVSVWLSSAWEGENAKNQIDGTDLIISIGGDGTILRAAQVARQDQIPITGINLGKLGFMTELGAAEALDKLPLLLDGKGWVDERAMVEAEILEMRGEAPLFYALNDIVVARGAIARMIYVSATIDDSPLTSYRADGVIVATATGSTGYSFAAGGPILHPQAREFLLTPIVPHLTSNYRLVLPSNAVVKLHISTVHQATLSIDGHINLPLLDGATVTVRHSAEVTRFLRIHPASFYGSLEQRLRGKQQ